MTSELRSLPLGKTKTLVSQIGLGTGSMAGLGVKVDYRHFEEAIIAAYDGGIRHFDAAPFYGYGKAEYYLGHAVRELGIRDQVTLSTKAGRVLTPANRSKEIRGRYPINWIDPLPFYHRYDYSYDGIMRSFEGSQFRLGFDFIDILLLHDVGEAWHGDDAEIYWKQLAQSGYKALDELRNAGMVSAVGLGVNETEAVLRATSEFTFDCALIAGRYSLLNHEPLEGAFDELLQRNVSIIAAGIFNSGILATGTRSSTGLYDYASAPSDIVDKVRKIEEVCDQFDISILSAAVEFVKLHPAITMVLMGVQNADSVRENLAATADVAPKEFWLELKRRKLIPEAAPTA
ncbi:MULTISPECIES: aldo/keto reductase [unclassified Burkholderia]|uniref:aldo/keto reductase n=1 Tax=unclassified Burkholderia TaxID=2613784 RepID=UPI000F56DFBB|nr:MULTISPECIES: aldo/keto reductase [unclassified Burkholderia]RQS26860.1 aldo/keto reductase [Burkholderia sp. Bp8995]RQS51746.1 aldo/keto reductase [Burkholderia sp. Bp8989]